MEKRIRLKERDAIIQSLKSGVTPKIGIQHIQVGRSNEVKALYKDIERISEGGAAFRLIIGDYGSGKTFFLSVVRSIALEKMLVSLTSFSQMHCNRKASLTWHEILRILDAGDDVLSTPTTGAQTASAAGPTGVYESAVRQLSGKLRANDTIVLSFVFRNPHPKIKDIDLRLIFQCSEAV